VRARLCSFAPCKSIAGDLFREEIAALLEDGGHISAQLGEGIQEVAWKQRSGAAAALELFHCDVSREW
jgi:hypothetical protein